MKVLLLNAPYPIPKMYGIKRSIPILMYKQLGIGYITAGLEKKGHEVKYLDCPALGMDTEDVIRFIRDEQPSLVGISCFVHGRFLVYDLLKEMKCLMPDLPVVVGGTQITLFAENVFSECPEMSLALRGEADFSFSELATRLEQGLPIDTVPGIVMRDESGNLVYGPEPESVQNLDTIPFPAWHVYDAHLYNPMPITLSLPTMRADQVITSRGCHWGRCRFCYQSNANMPCYRRRSPENVVAELHMLAEEHGIEFIVFLDDDFLQDEPWINQFCDLLDAAKLKLKWKAHGRVNMVTRTMLQRVAKSGCVHVTYGLESGNQETLNMIRKGTTLEQARQAVKWSHEAGLLVRGYIMFGLPRETPEMTEKSLLFAIELNLDYVSFMPYHVMDGTALEEIALQEGHCVEHDNLDLQMPSYIPDTYESVEQLNRAIHNAYRRYYIRPRYIMRALWSARNPKVWPALLSRVLVGLQIVFLSNR